MFDYKSSNEISNSAMNNADNRDSIIQTPNFLVNISNEVDAVNVKVSSQGNGSTSVIRDVHPQENPLPVVQVPVENVPSETFSGQQNDL